MSEMYDPALISLVAVLISLLAVLISREQAKISEKHNRLSVRPQLKIEGHNIPGKDIGLIIENSGIGPAIIVSITFYIDHNPYSISSEKEWLKILDLLEINWNYIYWKTIQNRDSVLNGQISQILVIEPEKQTPERIEKFINAINKIGIIYQYESLYGDLYEGRVGII